MALEGDFTSDEYSDDELSLASDDARAAENPSRLLADALRHIDGLITTYEEKRASTVGMEGRLVSLATDLREHIEELNMLRQAQGKTDDAGKDEFFRASEVPEETVRVIYDWTRRQLGVKNYEDEIERLKKKLEMQKDQYQQLSLAESEVKRLYTKLRTHEYESQRLQEVCNRLEEELKQHENSELAKCKDAKGRKRAVSDVHDLHRPTRMRHSSSTPDIHRISESVPNILELTTNDNQQKNARNDEAMHKGWRLKLGNMLGRNRVKSVGSKSDDTAEDDTPATELPIQRVPIQNERARQFYTLEEDGILAWLQDAGLSKYSSGIIRYAPSGHDLVTLVSTHQEHLAGITNLLHQKKLQLALRNALTEKECEASHLDHHWVADWTVDIGLPQYRENFLEGLVDGSMLNEITYDDLATLGITNTFHQISLKRAIQGLRLSAFRRDYLELWSSVKGVQQVLLWPASRVSAWLKRIDLGDYVGHLEGAGLHGALMLLEVSFTEESLAKILGIPPGKVLLRRHLAKRFMDVVGPVVAQNKLDAQQTKGFIPLDPLKKTKKRARTKKELLKGDKFLCPFEQKILGKENSPPGVDFLVIPDDRRTSQLID